MKTKWSAIRTGKGREHITAYIELFWSASCRWVTIPGASRTANADGVITEAAKTDGKWSHDPIVH